MPNRQGILLLTHKTKQMITLMSTLGAIAGVVAITGLVAIAAYMIYSKGKTDGRKQNRK